MKTLCLVFALTAANAASVTVPLIVEGNAPIVNVRVKHGASIRMARFLVDTGGGAVIFGSKVMADIGAKPTGPEMNEGGDRMVPVDGVTLAIGGMEVDLKDVRLFAMTSSARTMRRNDVEGLLPAGVLRKYRVTFDYPGRKFKLAPEHGQKGKGVAVKTPIGSRSGFPRLEAQIGGKSYGFLLDTGASFTMVSLRPLTGWKAENPQWPEAIGAVGFSNMFGGDFDNKSLMLRADKVQVATFPLSGVAIVSRAVGTFEDYMSPAMSSPIIGAIAGNVLRDFRVEIDYQRGITYLQKRRSSNDSDLTGVGLVVGVSGSGDVAVTGIGSTAADETKRLVQRRDVLLAIDRRNVSGEPIALVAELLSGAPGSKKRLTLRRNGEQLEVEVPVVKLL